MTRKPCCLARKALTCKRVQRRRVSGSALDLLEYATISRRAQEDPPRFCPKNVLTSDLSVSDFCLNSLGTFSGVPTKWEGSGVGWIHQ